VLSRDPLFEDMAFHRTALDYVRAVLGWPALLGNISANITGPGGGEMVLHADQIFVPEPWPSAPLAYYHVVFTLPARIGDIALHNKAVVYDILFKAASRPMARAGARAFNVDDQPPIVVQQ
jgi:hypothetical protein